MVAAALEEAAAVKEGTDPADERPPAFSCSGACFYRRISGEIFTLLVYMPPMICVLQRATALHHVVTEVMACWGSVQKHLLKPADVAYTMWLLYPFSSLKR